MNEHELPTRGENTGTVAGLKARRRGKVNVGDGEERSTDVTLDGATAG